MMTFLDISLRLMQYSLKLCHDDISMVFVLFLAFFSFTVFLIHSSHLVLTASTAVKFTLILFSLVSPFFFKFKLYCDGEFD